MEQNEIYDLLQDFFGNLKALCQEVFENGEYIQGSDNFNKLVEDAFKKILDDDVLNTMALGIISTKESDTEPDDCISNIELLCAELSFFNNSYSLRLDDDLTDGRKKEGFEVGKNIKESIEKFIDRYLKIKGKRWIKKLLDIINEILGIGKAITGGG